MFTPSGVHVRTDASIAGNIVLSGGVGFCAEFLSGRSRWDCPGVPTSSKWMVKPSDQWSTNLESGMGSLQIFSSVHRRYAWKKCLKLPFHQVVSGTEGRGDL